MLTWVFQRFEAVLTRDASRAEVLAAAEIDDDRDDVVVLAARGPKRCVLHDEAADGSPPDGRWIAGDLLAPQTFYQGDVVRFPRPIDARGGRTPAEPVWSPRRKFQHFLNLAKFSFYYVAGGQPEAIGTKYGALGNPSPPPCTVEVRPARLDAAGTEVELTILQDGEPVDGVEVRVRPDPAEQGTARWWNGDPPNRRRFARVTSEEGAITCFLIPAAGTTSMRIRVRVDGLGRPTHVTIPVGAGADPVTEDDELDAAPEEEGVVVTEQAWRMPLGWNPRARPASPSWFESTRDLTFPDPPTHAWACSPLTAMFFGYWYNANRSIRNDYSSPAPRGFANYFTPVRWDRDYPNVPAAADRDALLARITNRPVGEAQMNAAGARFGPEHIPAIYLAEQDRWKHMLEEVNFYKRFPRAHAMMLVKIAGPDTPPEVSRLRIYNPLTGEPFPEGLYQFSADGQWFQGNYFVSRVAFEYAAPQIAGLPDAPASIRYFSCGPTHFVRLLPAAGPDEAHSLWVHHPGLDQQSEVRDRTRRARRARSGATDEPVFDPTGPWSDWTKSLLLIWRGLRMGEAGRPTQHYPRTPVEPPVEGETAPPPPPPDTPVDGGGPWGTNAPLPVRMERFEHRYESEWPAAHPARARYTAFVPPSVPFPSKRELDANRAALELPYIESNPNGNHWRHWRACWPWIRQDDSKRWMRKSWPHSVDLSINDWLAVMERHKNGGCSGDEIGQKCDTVWASVTEPGGGLDGRRSQFAILYREAQRELPASLWSDYRAKLDALGDLRGAMTDLTSALSDHAAFRAEVDGPNPPGRRDTNRRGRAIHRRFRDACGAGQLTCRPPFTTSSAAPSELTPGLEALRTEETQRTRAAQRAGEAIVSVVDHDNARFRDDAVRDAVTRHARGSFESPIVVPPATPVGIIAASSGESDDGDD